MRAVSLKRARQLREYAILRAEMLDGAMCVRCGGPATVLHHLAGRADERLTDPDNVIPMCDSDHTRVHLNPAWAYEQNLMTRRNGRTE